jgi:hypothetical protein
MPIRSLVPVSLVLAVCWIIVAVGTDSMQAAANLPHSAWSEHPYFVSSHFWLLYVWAPVLALSSFLIVLSPGMALLSALGGDSDQDRWLLKSLGLGLIVTTASVWTADNLFGIVAQGTGFVAVTAVSTLVFLAASMIRLRRGGRIHLPSRDIGGSGWIVIIVPLFLLMVALVPKIFWEGFNGDGAHAFEVSRLVVSTGLPFLSPDAGTVADFPGATSQLFTYPNSWFIRMFGELEASVRLPFFLYLAGLHAAISAAASAGENSSLSASSRWVLWLGLAAYAVVVSFSATYNPYHADLALPATQDTLFVVCFLAFVVFFVRREHGWMVLFFFLTLLSLPSWMILVGTWTAAVIVLWRPVPWRTVIIASFCVVLGLALPAALPFLLAAVNLPQPGSEYAAGGLLTQLRYVQFADLRRFLFVLIPSGILPALGLLAWKRQDTVARALVLVTLVYFAIFYFKADTALHYFIPAMLLPLAVFWRLELKSVVPKAANVAVASAAVIALLLSLPQDRSPHLRARLIGSASVDDRQGYEAFEPAFFRGLDLYGELFPPPWDPRVPSEMYGGSPLAWNYYSQRRLSTEKPNYFLTDGSGPVPAAARLVATEESAALFVRSDSVWRVHSAPPRTSSIGAIYSIPSDVLIGTGRTTSFRVFDTHAALRKLLGG